MGRSADKAGRGHDAAALPAMRGRLFRKYALMFVTVVCAALAINGALDIWVSYREQESLLVRIQHEQAEAAAASINHFVKEIEDQMAWSVMFSWDGSTYDEWRLDAIRMLREVPAVSEVAQIDGSGRELYRLSRQAIDVVGSHEDHSHEPFFIGAMTDKIYYGPVYFVDGSEPHMTLAMAGSRPGDGVIEAQVDLRFIWDVVSQIKVGHHGYAYVIDAGGRLIAHPDLSLVLRNTDLSHLPQVRRAHMESAEPAENAADYALVPSPFGHGSVLSANALVGPLNWRVFVDLPVSEAFAPIYSSIVRSVALLLAALALAFLAGLALARRMVVPIRALYDGAARVGSGDLAHRIAIETGDELEALGHQFNGMAARLQESHATLEGKVQERTQQLEAANLAKTRFLAAASHDLRQPLHAVGLFVAQLHGRLRKNERMAVVRRVEAALSAMNELFNSLLDISKLDAGGTTANISNFAVAQLLAHAETTFAEAARAKGLSFRVLRSNAWIKSDFILLERIVFNLISNAVRYTNSGGIRVGCRRRGDTLRIEVWDTGVGIPADQHDKIFGEFYRLGEPDRRTGLGLGLAIVDRACRLLNHGVEVKSVSGKGSCFAITVPTVPAQETAVVPVVPVRSPLDGSTGKLVLVIDNDPLVLEGMAGILRSWGCRVVIAMTDDKALEVSSGTDPAPDLIISDYHLSDGRTGLQAIERLRGIWSTAIPAFLISGDTAADVVREVKASGCHLLHKPVDPMALRAMFNQAVKRPQGAPKPVAGERAPSEIFTSLDSPAASNRVH
jgi:signal transduction histidine kinase/ActR/RegA family two-component response regulator